MGLLTWIIIGAIAGWLASLIANKGFGLVGNILVVGIVGAFLGGWLSTTVLGLPYGVTGLNLASILVATAGAIVLLFIVGLIRR